MDSTSFHNIVLIGMPGAGKTTVGVRLAEAIGFEFVDTDDLLVSKLGSSLQEYMDLYGWQALRDKEAETLLSLDCSGTVISTGGSAIYSDEAMKHLAKLGVIVFLDIELAEIERRVHNFRQRGIAKPEHQSLEQLFTERRALYLKYSQYRVDNNALSERSVCEHIRDLLNK